MSTVAQTTRQTVVISHAGGYVDLRISQTRDGHFKLEQKHCLDHDFQPIATYDTPDEIWEALRQEVDWND